MSYIVDFIYHTIGFKNMASAAQGEDEWRFYDDSTDFNLVLLKGDIIDQNVGVMINIVTPTLDRKKGLWEKWASMDKVRDECLAKAPEGLEKGEYVVTSLNDGPGAQLMYHWACEDDNTRKVDFELYKLALSETFEIANLMELKSMTVPILDEFRFEEERLVPDNKIIALELCNSLLDLAKNQKPLHTITVSLLFEGKRSNDVFEVYKEAIKLIKQSFSVAQLEENANNNSFSNRNQLAKDHTEPSSRSVNRGLCDISPPPVTNNQNSSYFPHESVGGQVIPPQSSYMTYPEQGEGARPKQQIDNRGKVPKAGGLSKIKVNVKIYSGDLTKKKADAIVHPSHFTGSYIDTSGSVGKALIQAGGKEFTELCWNTGRRTQSEILVTDSGQLPCRKVIHVNTDSCYLDVDWVDRITKCLNEAERRRFTSITFPAMGLDKTPDEDKARNFKQAIDEFKRSSPKHLDQIYIVLWGSASLITFHNIVMSSGSSAEKTKSGSDIQVFTSRNASDSSTATSKSLKGVNIVVKEGDITQEDGDCVVHGVQVFTSFSAFIHLDDKVGQALRKKGGQTFISACNITKIYQNGYAITTGGHMKCNNVLHIDIYAYVCKTKNWVDFMPECLKAADRHGIRIILFPLIGGAGTDIGELTKQQMIGVNKFIEDKTTSIKEIRFVVFENSAALNALKDCLKPIGPCRLRTHAGDSQRPTQASKGHQTPGCSINILVVEGDISKNSCDMVIHGTYSCKDYIPINDTIGQVLAKAGGQNFTYDCNKKGIDGGRCRITRSGNLPCGKVLHVDIGNVDQQNSTLWSQRLFNVLLTAENEQMTSLAFPPLGTTDQSEMVWKSMATLFKETIESFAFNRKPKHIKMIQIVIYKNRQLFTAFNGIITLGAGPPPAVIKASGKRGNIAIKGLTSEAKLEIEIGDLTNEKSDAIIHPTNNQWSFSHTVIGKAIRQKGGQQLEDARNRAKGNGVDPGKRTCVSSAGKLPCKLVMHLDITRSPSIEDLVYACLVEARNSNIKSISFPALGTGKMGKGPEVIANDFKNAIHRFYNLREPNNLSRIRIVIFEKAMKDTFINVLEALSS